MGNVYIEWGYMVCFLWYLPGLSALDLHLKYFADAHFSCMNNASLNLSDVTSGVDIVNKAWILPSGRHISSKHKACYSDSRVSVTETNDTFSLTVQRIKHEDFGEYICILFLSDSNFMIFRHTLNTDGPLFANLDEKYRERLIFGFTAAAATIVVLIVAYVIWKCYCSPEARRRRRLLDDLNNGADRFSTHAYDDIGLDLVKY